MGVTAINDNWLQVQLSSPAGGAAVRTARTLQEKTPASAQTPDTLDRAISAVESGRSVEMHYDKDIGMVVVQIMDGQTNSVICQIPPEEIVNSMKSFSNYLKVMREGV